MLRALYATTATLLAPALRLWIARRVRTGHELPNRVAERRGIDTGAGPTGAGPTGRVLWLHASSVGETNSVLPVLAALARLEPDATLLMTTGTVSAAGLLAARLPVLGLEARVIHRFAPWDVPKWVARFLDHWRPDAVAFVESEVWPNLLAACSARRIPVMLVNARLSARSLARWRLLGAAGRAVFAGFSRAQAQSTIDADRLRAMALMDIPLTGNLKFAAPPLPVDTAELARLLALIGDRPRWLASCTHPGEEQIVLAVHAELVREFSALLTIIVPRHPHRGEEVQRLAPSTRRAAGQDPPNSEGIWIGDTLGELGLYYSLVGHAFIGGSLVAMGGQNPLEAARLGCATAIGPYTENQREAVAMLEQAGALEKIGDAAGLAGWSGRMLREPASRDRAAQAGIAVADGAAELPEQVARAFLGLLG